MFKKFKIELPNFTEEQLKNQKFNVIRELQNNIDMQLNIIQDRIRQEVLIDLEDIKTVLQDAESVIEECYSTPDFKSNSYKNFSILIVNCKITMKGR